MELFWIYYQGNKGSRYILILYLGDKETKYCGLEAQFIVEADNKIIRSSIAELHKLSLGKKLLWIKEKCPESYKNAYKELKKDNSTIIKKYPIN
jgi:putative cell wall-binding protein